MYHLSACVYMWTCHICDVCFYVLENSIFYVPGQQHLLKQQEIDTLVPLMGLIYANFDIIILLCLLTNFAFTANTTFRIIYIQLYFT